MTGAARQAASLSPIAQVVLTVAFFLIAGPLIGGPVTIPIVWYFSVEGMNASQAAASGLVVTLLGFWAIIPAGAIPALGVGLAFALVATATLPGGGPVEHRVPRDVWSIGAMALFWRKAF